MHLLAAGKDEEDEDNRPRFSVHLSFREEQGGNAGWVRGVFTLVFEWGNRVASGEFRFDSRELGRLLIEQLRSELTAAERNCEVRHEVDFCALLSDVARSKLESTLTARDTIVLYILDQMRLVDGALGHTFYERFGVSPKLELSPFEPFIDVPKNVLELTLGNGLVTRISVLCVVAE